MAMGLDAGAIDRATSPRARSDDEEKKTMTRV